MAAMNERTAYFLMAVLLGAMAMLGPLSIDIVLPTLPAMAEGLGEPMGRIELSMTAIFAGGAVGQLLFGPLSDRFGRKPVVLIALVLFTVSTIGVSQSNTLEPIIFWRFVQGVVLAAGRIIANAAARDQYEKEQLGKLISLIFIVSVSASVINPLIGGFMVTRFGWQSVFLVMTGYGVILIAAVLFFFKETIPRKDPTAIQPIRIILNFSDALKNREYNICLLSGGFAVAGFIAFLSASPGLAKTAFNLTPQEYSFGFAGVISTFLVISVLSNRYVERAGIHRLIILGGLLEALGGLSMLGFALVGATHPLTLFGPMALFVVGFSFLYPLATAKALTPFKTTAGTASSLLGFTQNIMGAVISALLAIFIDGTTLPMAIALALCGVGSAAVYILNRGGNPPVDGQAA